MVLLEKEIAFDEMLEGRELELLSMDIYRALKTAFELGVAFGKGEAEENKHFQNNKDNIKAKVLEFKPLDSPKF